MERMGKPIRKKMIKDSEAEKFTAIYEDKTHRVNWYL